MKAAHFARHFAFELAKRIEAPKGFISQGEEVPYVRALTFDPTAKSWVPLELHDTLLWNDDYARVGCKGTFAHVSLERLTQATITQIK